MQRWQRWRPPYNALECQRAHAHIATLGWQAGRRYSNGSAATASRSRDAPLFGSNQDVDRIRESKRLLRALLRECTYLPDSFARRWMRGYVRARFERYSEKARLLRHDPQSDQRERSKLHEARQGLGTLRRANEGERKPLLKILLMAYGRNGKRRHELMLPLMSRDASGVGGDHVDVTSRPLKEAMQDVSQRPSSIVTLSIRGPSAVEVNKGAWTAYVPNFSTQMRALLESTIRSPPPHLVRPVLRRLHPRIDEHNAWHRPMPLVRVKNQVKAWYAGVLERTHPPLPMPEWRRLFDLATGRRRESCVPRRTPAGSARKSALEMTVLYGKTSAKMAFGNSEAHQLTPRYMQHLWAQVFAQCPAMEWDGNTSTWKVTWGEQALLEHASSFTKPCPSPAVKPVDNIAVSNHNA